MNKKIGKFPRKTVKATEKYADATANASTKVSIAGVAAATFIPDKIYSYLGALFFVISSLHLSFIKFTFVTKSKHMFL